jgi:outer membrane protein OmpA-like peptidoglycan-associated protein
VKREKDEIEVMKKLALFSTLSLSALALLACGAATPTKELRDARAAYQEASQGKAAELAPDKLLTAKQALDRAESAFQEDPGSYQEKSLAYVAQRMAQLASAQAGQIDAQKAAEKAEEDYKEAQDQLRKAAQDDAARTAAALRENQERLEKVRRDLADQDNKLGEAASKLKAQEEELARKKAELEARQKELDAEKAARAEAEKKLAAAMKSLEEIAKVKEEQRGLVITLDGAVLFASGKTTLLPIAQDKLGKVAEVLQQQSDDKKIVVEGHTDSVGSDAANLKLSQERADAVRTYLVSRGVKADRITAVGKGETVPIADNKSAEGRANNRRVEIVVK